MSLRNLGISRRSLVIAAAAVATVISLGIGANAALNKISNDARQAVFNIGGEAVEKDTGPSRLALVIGNGRYPDASAPLAQPINDARALTAALRQDGFQVDVVEDANKEDMRRAVDRLKSKVKRDSVVMLFYSGYGIQAGRESYMIPVDATIWKEGDVRRHGTSVESVLDALKDRGARASLVVLDASRRNPFERRFRTFSHGLAAIDAPQNALILSSATPGKVIDDFQGREQRAGHRTAEEHEYAGRRRRAGLHPHAHRGVAQFRRPAGADRVVVADRGNPLRFGHQEWKLSRSLPDRASLNADSSADPSTRNRALGECELKTSNREKPAISWRFRQPRRCVPDRPRVTARRRVRRRCRPRSILP